MQSITADTPVADVATPYGVIRLVLQSDGVVFAHAVNRDRFTVEIVKSDSESIAAGFVPKPEIVTFVDHEQQP